MSTQNHKPRIAVVGSGYWGKNLVRNFHHLGVLHTICESDPDTLRSLRKQYPGVQCVGAFSDVLAQSDIDGIAISTPASSHASQVRESLLSGRDVYVEKPLCLSEEEGSEINQLAKASNRILMVGHILWYHPAILKLKDLIHDGELGRIQYIYSNRLNLGKLRREENVLWSFAPHDLSVIIGLLEEMPESVQAQGGNYLHQKIADTTTSLLNFASGVKAHVFVSWLHPYKEQKLIVVGDRKMAVFDDTLPWPQKLQLYPHIVKWTGNIPVATKAKGSYVEVPEDEPLRAECEHFIDCIKSRQTPRTDGEEGLRVLRVLNACQLALERQGPVSLSELDRAEKKYFTHETAFIDNEVQIGEGSKIWHFSHLLPGTKIGRSCTIGQNVVIGPNVTVGNGCKIQNNVSVYEGVTLEDDVFCGPSMVFTNVLNPRAHVSRKKEFKATLIKKGATIGANATIVCGLTLGEFSFVGAGAVVTKNIPAHGIVVGNPARHVGWMCACGERLIDELKCIACGAVYRKGGNGLIRLP